MNIPISHFPLFEVPALGKIHPLRRGHVFPPKDLLSSVLGRLSIALAPLAVSTWVAITRLEDYVRWLCPYRTRYEELRFPCH